MWARNLFGERMEMAGKESGESDNEWVYEGVTLAWAVLVEALVRSGALSADDLIKELDGLIERRKEDASPEVLMLLRSCMGALVVGAGAGRPESIRMRRPAASTEPLKPEDIVEATPFDLRFGPRLKKMLLEDRERIPLNFPIPGFLRGSSPGKPETLYHGHYERRVAEREGLLQLFVADGIEFLIPQHHVRDELKGNCIELSDDNKKLVLI